MLIFYLPLFRQGISAFLPGSSLYFRSKSIVRRDLTRTDTIEAAKFLQVAGGADQHDLGKFPGVDVLKSCYLFPSTDAGADHRLLVFLVIGALLLLFLEKHPVLLLNSEHQPATETLLWQLPSEPAAPGRK